MRVLAVNAGSSSLKLSVLEGRTALASHLVERWESGDVDAIGPFVDDQPQLDAVVHRVVHGGTRFHGPTVLDSASIEEIRSLTALAPLHQPRSLAGIDATARLLPDVTPVACFDTAFHVTIPAEAHTYALPAEWLERWPLRRFGFHGLSHRYAAGRTAQLIDRPVGDLRIVTCHLGSGSSLCAVRAGLSVDTTMGFTPLEGLVMRTRAGSVDPGLVVWLIDKAGLPVEEVSDGLEHRSGLVGLGGGSGDIRELSEAAERGEVRATLALAVHDLSVSRGVAAMAASMGGLDAVAFTGGIGEHASSVRAAVARRLEFLGVRVDAEANAAPPADREITGTGATVRTVVVEAREDIQMAVEATALLSR